MPKKKPEKEVEKQPKIEHVSIPSYKTIKVEFKKLSEKRIEEIRGGI